MSHTGDYLFRCPTRLAASLLHDLGAPVWLYEFGLSTRTPGFPCCDGLSCHTAELPYVFEQLALIENEYSWKGRPQGPATPGKHIIGGQNGAVAVSTAGDYTFLPDISTFLPDIFGSAASWLASGTVKSGADGRVATLMADYWTTFATHGDPNGILTRNGYKYRCDTAV